MINGRIHHGKDMTRDATIRVPPARQPTKTQRENILPHNVKDKKQNEGKMDGDVAYSRPGG